MPNRFVLADTEKLHSKIGNMSDRIRQLEDALAILQTSVAPGETHPLLDRDLLRVKSSLDLHSAVETHEDQHGSLLDTVAEEEGDTEAQTLDGFGTLAVSEDGGSTFYGRSAGSEVRFFSNVMIFNS